MDSTKPRPIVEYSHLKAQDQEEFFYLVSEYFRKRKEEFRGRQTIFLFAKIDGLFKIFKKITFVDEKKLKKFRRALRGDDYYFHLGDLKGDLCFDFLAQDYACLTNFDADYGTLADYLDENGELKTTKPKTFGELFVRKAVEQYVAETKAKKRKLAS